MGLFAETFGFTPQEFRSLSMEDFAELRHYLGEKAKASEKARQAKR